MGSDAIDEMSSSSSSSHVLRVLFEVENFEGRVETLASNFWFNRSSNANVVENRSCRELVSDCSIGSTRYLFAP